MPSGEPTAERRVELTDGPFDGDILCVPDVRSTDVVAARWNYQDRRYVVTVWGPAANFQATILYVIREEEDDDGAGGQH